jgi:hypothetical protein
VSADMAVKDGSADGGQQKPANGGQQKPWFRRLRPWPKRVRIAAAGYAVVAIFAIGVGVSRAVGASGAGALTVGILAAAPVVVAFIGERITGVKALGVEISLVALTNVKVEMAGDDSTIAGKLSAAAMEGAEAGQSGNVELVNHFTTLIQEEPKLLRINLRCDDYWWSTRIFLVAAIAQNYTSVEAIVFVRAGDEQVFVGIASPRAVRERLAAQFPYYETAYRTAQSAPVVLQGPVDPDNVFKINKVTAILIGGGWAQALPAEKDIKEIVTSKKIRGWLGGDLDAEQLPYGPLSALLTYRIVSGRRRYAALTDDRRLKAVVDRNELAVRFASAELERRLGERS